MQGDGAKLLHAAVPKWWDRLARPALPKRGRVMQIYNQEEYRARVRALTEYRIYDGKEENLAQLNVARKAGGLQLRDLWVTPENRRQGMAMALVAQAVEDWGHETLYLDASPFADRPMAADLLMRFFAKYFQFEELEVPGLMVRRAVER